MKHSAEKSSKEAISPVLSFILLMCLGYVRYRWESQATGIELVVVSGLILSLSIHRQSEVRASRYVFAFIACLLLSAWAFAEAQRVLKEGVQGLPPRLLLSSVGFAVASYAWISLSFRNDIQDLGASRLLDLSVAMLLLSNFGWYVALAVRFTIVNEPSPGFEGLRTASFILYAYLCARWLLWKLTTASERSGKGCEA